MTENIAIIGGTGNLGFGLAVRLGAAGFSVWIGSRDGERADQAAARARDLVPTGSFAGCANSDAVDKADRLVGVTVPFASQSATLKGLAEAWRPEHVVLDGTVPLATAVGGRPTQLIQPWAGSAAEQARSVLPDNVSLVSGLHTVSAAVLEDVTQGLGQDTLICGDDAPAKVVVTDILSQIEGLRVVDAGPLSMSRLIEGITPLLIGINIRNKTHAGIQLTNLPS